MDFICENLSSNKLYSISLTKPIERVEFTYTCDEKSIFTYIMEDEYIIINNDLLDLTDFNNYMVRVKEDHKVDEVIYKIVIFSTDPSIEINIKQL
jgi:hypothetical protein